jgi:hypothetical protein
MARAIASLPLFLSLAVLASAPARADDVPLGSIRIEAPEGDLRGAEFRRKVMAGLRVMKDKSPHLGRLLRAAQEAPAPITVHPMIDETGPHLAGDRYRPHARIAGWPSVARDGRVGFPAAIFLTPGMVNPHWIQYKRGLLPHELLHGVDIAYARMPRDRRLVERRAMFVENIWRDLHGWRLAEHYTDQTLELFETQEYQRAKARQAIARCMDVLLSVSSFACP